MPVYTCWSILRKQAMGKGQAVLVWALWVSADQAAALSGAYKFVLGSQIAWATIYYCVMLGKSFPSLSKPSFHHLRNWDIIKVASSGCCRHEIYTWQVKKKKCFLKGLAPNRCSITHIHYYYSGNCFLFKLLEKSSHFRDQDAKTILNTEKM